MPVIPGNQSTAVLKMLNAYADLTAANIGPTTGIFGWLKSGDLSTLNNIRNTKITWLSNNASSARVDSVLAARWYADAKATENLLQNINGWQYNSSLGTVDSIMGKGIVSNTLQGARQVATVVQDTSANLATTIKQAPQTTIEAANNLATKVVTGVANTIPKIGGAVFGIVPWYIWAGAGAIILIVGYTAVKGTSIKVGGA